MAAIMNQSDFDYDQLPPSAVADLVSTIDNKKGFIILIVPGYQLRSGEEDILIDTQTEFIDNPKLGMLWGVGKGHAYIRAAAVQSISPPQRRQIRDFLDLANAIHAAGYQLKKVAYFHFDPF